MELTPIDSVACWYIDNVDITKKGLSRGMKDLFEILPSYKDNIKDLTKIFEDEDELEDLGYHTIVERVMQLKNNGVIVFDKGKKTYALNEGGHESELSQSYNLYFIISEDLENLMDQGIDYIIKNGESEMGMTTMGNVLKMIRSAQKQKRKNATLEEMPEGFKSEDIHKIAFKPRFYVNKTHDYDKTYVFLKTMEIRDLFNKDKKSINSLKRVPGIKVIKSK
ncbi:MAG: hypothetical protein JSV92_02190 [archaeon]|nr:MAG: hypothetical protein JSV92_02190 [archaeon]